MNASSNPIKSGPPLLRRIVVWIIMVIGIPTLFFSGCQSKLIYFPRPYATGTIAQLSLIHI